MTLLDAEPYDPARERRRRLKIGGIVALILVLAGVAWLNRNWTEEHVVDRFFTALEQKNYEAAYAIWLHDPVWRQHVDRYSQYPFNDFYRDWGPGGEWGLIESHKVYGSINPSGGSSGVIVDVIVNDRTEHARIWVQKSDKTLSFSPY